MTTAICKSEDQSLSKKILKTINKNILTQLPFFTLVSPPTVCLSLIFQSMTFDLWWRHGQWQGQLPTHRKLPPTHLIRTRPQWHSKPPWTATTALYALLSAAWPPQPATTTETRCVLDRGVVVVGLSCAPHLGYPAPVSHLLVCSFNVVPDVSQSRGFSNKDSFKTRDRHVVHS